MKKYIKLFLLIAVLIWAPFLKLTVAPAAAQVAPANLWKLVSGVLQPINSAWTVAVKFFDNGGQVINVKALGAKCDGTTNDASAIQSAFNTASSTNGTVYFPAGTCVSNSIILVGSNTHVTGAGQGVSIVKQGFANTSGVDNKGLFQNADTVNGNSNITFSDLTILVQPVQTRANGVAGCTSAYCLTTSTVALFFQGVSDVTVQRVTAINGTLAFRPLPAQANTSTVSTTGKNNRIKVLNDYLIGGGEGIFFQQGTDLIAEGNQIVNTYDSSISINSSGERIAIGGNIFNKQGNQNPALGFVEVNNDGAGDANGIRDIVVSSNVMLNAGMSNTKAILFQGPVSNGVISNNEIRNLVAHGIYVSGGNYVSVYDNDIADLGSSTTVPNGIEIPTDVTSTNVSVIRNLVNNVTGSGLYIPSNGKGLTNVNASNNTFASSTQYGINIAANVTNGVVQGNTLSNNASGSYNNTGSGWGYSQFNGSNLGVATSGASTGIALGSGQITVPNGSNGSPAYSFSVNHGTGFYASGANLLDVAVNGTEVLESDNAEIYAPNSGGIMIKYASGASTNTPVFIPDRADQTTGFAAGVQGNDDVIVGGVEKARWTSTGYGVGTSAPSATVQIVDSVNNSSTIIIGASSTKSGCAEIGAASGTIGKIIFIYYDSNAIRFETTTKPAFCM